jgi:hypothetical protein
VQLGILPSEQRAQAEWQRVQGMMPALLSNHQPIFTKVDKPGGETIWLVRTGGFADLAQAAMFCQQVRTAGGDCFPTKQ